MSITSAAAKLTPPHTAADKLRHQLLDLYSCPALPYGYLLFFIHSPTSAQTSLPAHVGCSNAYYKNEALDWSLSKRQGVAAAGHFELPLLLSSWSMENRFRSRKLI